MAPLLFRLPQSIEAVLCFGEGLLHSLRFSSPFLLKVALFISEFPHKLVLFRSKFALKGGLLLREHRSLYLHRPYLASKRALLVFEGDSGALSDGLGR